MVDSSLFLKKPADFGKIIPDRCRRQVFYHLTALGLLVET
jgi:hypothetical protein